ncbi:tryptase gamma-like [Symsagittifera roscoffensis]|uniref:tryptase gamma-like n=1 Tax=Symsagittifera roscoffensis TaxID=84072 RepID=UPI00307C8515
MNDLFLAICVTVLFPVSSFSYSEFNSLSKRINGGHKSPPRPFYVVWDGPSGDCGGVIISPTWVIIPATCATDNGKTKALSRQVVVTDYSKSNWKTTQRRIGIRKVILPPGGMKAYWDRRPALIQLSKSVGRSKAIKLCLDDFGGSQVGYCGMGFTENWKKPSVLQEVIAKDVGKSACNKKDLNLNTMVCLKDQGSPNIETQEDMGAPAYVMRNGQPYYPRACTISALRSLIVDAESEENNENKMEKFRKKEKKEERDSRGN